MTMAALIITFTLPCTAWAFDSGLLNPDWRPGTTSTAPNQPPPNPNQPTPNASGNPQATPVAPANDPIQQNINNKYFDPNGAQKLQNEAGQLQNQMDQPSNPPSPSGTDLFKDPNLTDLIQSPPGAATNSNNSDSISRQTAPQPTGNNQNNNRKGKFGLLATLVCMGALFPISSAIRNIMMGFLTWLGVNEEKTARQMAGTLSGLASVSHLAGSGLNSIIGKSGNTFGGNTLGNVGSKVPPIGGGVGSPTGGVEKIRGSMLGGVSLGGVSNSSVPASPGKSIASGISAGGVAGNASQTKNMTGNVLGGSGTGKSTGVSSFGGSSPGSLPGSDTTGPITGPGSIGVGKIEEAESPQIGEAGNNPSAGVNSLPAEASAAIDGISGEGLSATSSPGGMAPLYKDMLKNDNQSRKIYNAVAQAGSLADGFAPGSSKLLAATASNLAAVPMAAYQVAKGVSQIKREGNMTFRDAVKAYTNSNNWGTGLAKMGRRRSGFGRRYGTFWSDGSRHFN